MKALSAVGVVVAFALAFAVEGAFFATLPYALIHGMYLPAIYLRRRSRRVGCLFGLVCFECLFMQLPILAGVSMIVVIETVIELLSDDFNLRSPLFAGLLLPGIDLSRQFWTAIFAALYGLPSPAPISVPQLIYALMLGLALHLFLKNVSSFDTETPPHGQWA